MFLLHPRVKMNIVGSLRDQEEACSASVWRTVSSQSSHHPQKVLLAQFSLYVHKGGLKPDSLHFINPYNAKICLSKPWRPKDFFQFEMIINVFVSSLCFIWRPTVFLMLSILFGGDQIWTSNVVKNAKTDKKSGREGFVRSLISEHTQPF